MPDLLQFPSLEELPAHYAQQIRDFIRINWYDGYVHDVHEPLFPASWNPHVIALVDGPALFSSATVVWKMIEHAGQPYKTYGLSSVMTYPAFRKKGYGRCVVDAATATIRAAGDADVGILWTQPHNHNFYAQSGWEHPEGITMLVGEPPQPFTAYLMMLFLSDRARKHRSDFESTPVYFGPHSW
jgi:GNAT superfamily N-acetyltransferase